MKVVVTLTKKFFNGHRRAGQPTDFADLVLSGKKIHTCRYNYDYWAKKIKILKDAGGMLCIREWSGKPYRSPQSTIVEIPSEFVHVSKLKITRIRIKHPIPSYVYIAVVNKKWVSILDIARNDGFSNIYDFESFIEPIFDRYKINVAHFAIIHFNEFNY